ncbi:hypothetical protein [Bacteroides heparinolyticus]|uniref:hypothetical protein n=1 Tax=Prevotella heparinolytica TaxID=28113 RepID=UPI0035A0D067
MKEEIKNPVELRSEKVRNIIGRIPSALVRYGTIIIGLSLLMLLIVSAFIPYRETVPVKISVESDGGVYGKAVLSKERLVKVKAGNRVSIDDPLIGYMEATVIGILPEPLPGDGAMREITVAFSGQPASKPIRTGDVLDGRIVLSDISVLRKFLQSAGFR